MESDSTSSESDESLSSTVDGAGPTKRCDWWRGHCFREEEDYVHCTDLELQALIAQRDSINASIEEQMRSHNMELPLVTDPSSKAELSFMVPAVEKQWRTEGCAEQIVLGSLFLALCELWLRAAALCRSLIHGCGMIGLKKSAALRLDVGYNLTNLVILVPFALMNVGWKNKTLHLFLTGLAYLDRLVSSLPLLHYACGRKKQENLFACGQRPDPDRCQGMVYDLFHLQMLSVMAQVVLLPEYKYCSYMWIWIFLATLISSTFVLDENITAGRINVDEAQNEFLVRLILLSLVQMVANRKKCTMEEQNRALFLTNNKNKKVSQSMFKILEYMVPSFVILPMLRHAQHPGTSLHELSYRFDNASVLFIAFDDFDDIVQQSTPPEILQFLNKFYNRFDVLCANKQVTKIETVGEEYVCAVGVQPGSELEDPEEALGKLISFAREVLTYEGASFKMGIHSGPVVAGVIGNKLPRYRLFGNTVNMAARMMQKGLPGHLQFGEATCKLLPDGIKVKYRGEVEMKGKGLVKVFFLDDEKSRKKSVGASLPSSKGPLKTTKELYKALLAGKHAASEGTFSASSSEFNEIIQEVFRDTTPSGSCWRRLLSFLCPGWGRFPKDMAQEYRNWYLHTVFADNFSALRLRRQAMFLLILTVVETGYMLFMSQAFYTWPKLWRGFRSLKVYFALRAMAILVSLSMACFCPPLLRAARQQWWNPNGHRCWPIHVLSQTGHFLFVSILVLSYFLLPAYANKGMESVPDNVVALMTLPVYAAVMMSYQQEFLTSVVYIVAFAVMITVLAEIPSTKTNGYPSEGITFLGYSMIFALKAYMGERSLRDQFKARHAINDCKVHIEGILETLMPERVIEELQRSGPHSSAPSHQYYRATLVQSDLIGFTSMASSKPPEEVVRVVSDLFGMFDELADEFGIYKVETVGDAYIAGQAELPLTEENYPPNVIRFGLDMVSAAKRWSRAADANIGVRVGVHSGECIGGIVGIDMQRYHLFGQLMHQLEILESTAPENGLQVSSACKAAVDAAWASESRKAGGLLPGVPWCDFIERPEAHLTTSKGEIHQYSEVGGKTYTVHAVVGNGLE